MKLPLIGFLATATTLATAFVSPSARTLTNVKPFQGSTYSQRSVSTHVPQTIARTAGSRLWETADASVESSSTGGGTATVPELIFNLVKSIVGAGVLGLPAGIVAFGNAPSAAIPAAALITIIGALSGYGFGLIGRSCAYTGTTSIRGAWSVAVSPKTAWIPSFTVTFKTICAVVAYSMILGDTFSSLAAGAGYIVSPTTCLLGVTSLVLLPLCLLKNLSSLAPFSLLGSLGMVYTAVAMAIRYFGKAYVKGGKFAKALDPALAPRFGTIGAEGALNSNVFILIAMLSTAYMVC